MSKQSKVTKELVRGARNALLRKYGSYRRVDIRNATGGSSKIVNRFLLELEAEESPPAPQASAQSAASGETSREDGLGEDAGLAAAPSQDALPALQAELQSLIAAMAELRRVPIDLEVLRREMASLHSMLEKALPARSRSRGGPPPEPSPNTGRYSRMSVRKAAYQVLLDHQDPMSTREIAAVMENAGFEFTREDPPHAVNHALTKSAEHGGDVVRVLRGKWAVRSRYTAEQLREIEANLNLQPERDADLHGQRVRDSIARAKARGVRFGRVPFEEKYSPAVLDEFRRLRAEGCSLKDALVHIAMPRSTYTKHRERIEGIPSSSKG